VVTVSVELPVPPEAIARLVGLRKTDGPDGEEVAARLTVPEKLLLEATLMVDVPLEPATIGREVGLALMVKSGVGVD